MTPVAPRIVSGVTYVRRINHESHFPWRAQYLVKFKRHCSWQVSLFVAGAAFREIWNDSRSAKGCIFQ